MFGQTETIEQYNNAGALLGLDEIDNDEVMGALKKMNPIQRVRTINKLAQPAPPSKGSRAEMEKHFTELPAHIKEGLKKGELRLADTIIYSIKPASSKPSKCLRHRMTRRSVCAIFPMRNCQRTNRCL